MGTDVREAENGSIVFYYLSSHTQQLKDPFSGTTQVSWYQKGKPVWILLKQETVRGSGISWAICKSAPSSRQTTMPAPHHSVFYRPFLPPNQLRQSTEGHISAVSRRRKKMRYSLWLAAEQGKHTNKLRHVTILMTILRCVGLPINFFLCLFWASALSWHIPKLLV